VTQKAAAPLCIQGDAAAVDPSEEPTRFLSYFGYSEKLLAVNSPCSAVVVCYEVVKACQTPPLRVRSLALRATAFCALTFSVNLQVEK
jgi:hypothetical protein